MGDAPSFSVITSDTVRLHISTSKNDISFNEKRFPKNILVSNLKMQLEMMTGASCATMKIEAYSRDDQLVCQLDDEGAMMGAYPLEDGMRLHVVDAFLLSQSLDVGDNADVPKLEISEEDYQKRPDTVRQFLIKNKLRQYSEDSINKKQLDLQKSEQLINSMQVGARCKVAVTNAPTRLGTIRYLGKVDDLEGLWVGVEYDEPLGKHNGTCKGKQYFECQQNYGGFVKPATVQVGDFPVEDYDLDEEI